MNNTIKKFNIKRFVFMLTTLFTVMCLCITPTFAWGRKLINKTVNDSFTIYSAYHYNYHFNAQAVITYNDSNSITQISDLAFSNIGYTHSNPSLTASFTPAQKSKSNLNSYARYVVTLTRNVYGYYTDKVDYTLTYRPSDYGTPYSLKEGDKLILVDVEVGEPYDIMYLDEVN